MKNPRFSAVLVYAHTIALRMRILQSAMPPNFTSEFYGSAPDYLPYNKPYKLLLYSTVGPFATYTVVCGTNPRARPLLEPRAKISVFDVLVNHLSTSSF